METWAPTEPTAIAAGSSSWRTTRWVNASDAGRCNELAMATNTPNP
jgi:hypothetical protein